MERLKRIPWIVWAAILPAVIIQTVDVLGPDGKRIVVVDDVVSSGETMRKTIRNLRSAGADVKLCLVLANKTHNNELEGVPLRGLVRVVTV